MNDESHLYPIDRPAVANYFYWSHILLMVIGFGLLFGVGIVGAIVYAYTVGTWLPRRQAEAMRYWLQGTTLRVDCGVWFLKRKAIPLDRVTDVMLVQGPLLRWFGLWALHIQTAGQTGGYTAEAILIGLEKPEEVRDELLKARDEASRLTTA